MSRAALLLLALAGCAPAGLRVEAEADPARVRVVAPLPAGLAEGPLPAPEAERHLRLVRVDPETSGEGPPLLGDYAREDGRLVFRPRHPLAPGERYRAAAGLARVDYAVPPRPSGPPAEVVAIYPTADRLPANLLKFYLHFSKPMREGARVFDGIRLRRSDGSEIAEPWRRAELWTEDARRLTLWIHPGRVKRGVNLREQEGPVLEPGRSYTLEIGAELLDGEGRPMGRAFTKRFTAVEEDHEKPDPWAWRIEPPKAGTRDPLTVRFPEPLDRWLLARGLSLGVAGRPSVGPGETSWSFTPADPWPRGELLLRIQPLLEDLAGNTPQRRFEEQAGEEPRPPAPVPVRITE
ncbi:MAG TPA: hypothetical protein VEJ18_15740 [Planctomycetota bacterium]|nr:hypothetical protein [Planctomycetota bacterium]